MILSIVEPFREPRGPIGGHNFKVASVDEALQRLEEWPVTGRMVVKIEQSLDCWITFETRGEEVFEVSFQEKPGEWHRIIGSTFNAQGCGVLARALFEGNQDLLMRYALDTRESHRSAVETMIAKVLGRLR